MGTKPKTLMGMMLCFCLIVMGAGEAQAAPVLSKMLDWTVYGKVKMDVNVDTVQFVNYNDFLGAVANPLVVADWTKTSTNFNPRDTRFGFWAKLTHGNWDVEGRFELDFYGTNAGNNLLPRMRLGYIDAGYNPWGTRILVGQQWIRVSQLNPSTIDFGILSAAGNLWWRLPQVTVTQTFAENFEFLVSIMKHRRVSTASNDGIPWFLGRLAYHLPFEKVGGFMALGGGWRKADYSTASVTTDIQRWLVSGEMKIACKTFIFKGEFWYGAGLGESFLRYNLDVNPVTGEAITAIGGWADLTWKPTSKVSVTAGYGIDDPDDGEMMAGRTVASLNNRQFTRNQIVFANFWYSILQPLKVGVEYMHVMTTRGAKDVPGDPRRTDAGDRITASMQLTF